jgi:hypothetical protein
VSLWNPARLLKEHCADRPNQMKSLALALAALVSGVASANSALLAFKGGIGVDPLWAGDRQAPADRGGIVEHLDDIPLEAQDLGKALGGLRQLSNV